MTPALSPWAIPGLLLSSFAPAIWALARDDAYKPQSGDYMAQCAALIRRREHEAAHDTALARRAEARYALREVKARIGGLRREALRLQQIVQLTWVATWVVPRRKPR